MIHAREVDAPEFVSSPIEWMLLTMLETRSFEETCERIRWYAKRWGIEVYHRTLKSGCRIGDQRLGNIDSLQTGETLFLINFCILSFLPQYKNLL